jgi:hypothetical protein
MAYAIYTTQAAAQAALDAVNAAFESGLQPEHVTQRWADLTECAEGWAFEKPLCPELCTLLGEHTEAESMTVIEAEEFI